MEHLTEEEMLRHILDICRKYDKREHNSIQEGMEDAQTTIEVILISVYKRLTAVEKEMAKQS